MTNWTVPSIDKKPDLTLYPWQIFEFRLGNGLWERTVVGQCFEIGSLRTTSVIRKFNIATMRAQTLSGRVYQLMGPPGNSHDLVDRFKFIADFEEISGWQDVSEQVYAEHIKAPD